MSQASSREIRATSRGSGDVAGMQHASDAPADLPHRRAIDRGMARGAEDPRELPVPPLQDAALHETGQRLLANGLRFVDGQVPDPRPGVRRFRAGRDPGQDAIEHGIAGRRAVVDHERPQVGVDPPGERQIHQHRARQGALERIPLDGEQRAILIGQQQDELFGEGQHGTVG